MIDDLSHSHPPNRFPWPPVLFGFAALVALLLHRAIPLPWPHGAVAMVLTGVGVVLVLTAIVLDVSAMLSFRSVRTTVMPHRGATTLVTGGPFRISRNPIYVAHTCLLAGAGLVFGVGWLLPAAIAAAVATHYLAVLREEKHLAARFGDAWILYKSSVPRWVGFFQRRL